MVLLVVRHFLEEAASTQIHMASHALPSNSLNLFDTTRFTSTTRNVMERILQGNIIYNLLKKKLVIKEKVHNINMFLQLALKL